MRFHVFQLNNSSLHSLQRPFSVVGGCATRAARAAPEGAPATSTPPRAAEEGHAQRCAWAKTYRRVGRRVKVEATFTCVVARPNLVSQVPPAPAAIPDDATGLPAGHDPLRPEPGVKAHASVLLLGAHTLNPVDSPRTGPRDRPGCPIDGSGSVEGAGSRWQGRWQTAPCSAPICYSMAAPYAGPRGRGESRGLSPRLIGALRKLLGLSQAALPRLVEARDPGRRCLLPCSSR
jgi:hypothetical protein